MDRLLYHDMRRDVFILLQFLDLNILYISQLTRDSKSATTTSDLVHVYRTSMNEMALHLNITLHWVRRNGTFLGNRIVDELT